MSRIATIVVGWLVLLAGSAHAAVNTIGSCPFTILQPGQYHIVKNLSCPGGGITIDADNVELHFDGHTLDGADTGTFGVLAAGSNESIFGSGTVTRFQFGIVIESFSDEELTSGSRLVNVTVTNSHAQGILLINSVQNAIINCTANNNRTDGISLASNSSNNTLISNTASSNGGSGIHLFDNSDNKLTANQTDNNHFNGIFLDFGFSGNLVLANRASNNVPFDLADANAGCDSNIWKSNHFRTANQPCIN